MLVLTRKTDEQILIGDNIKITLVRVSGNSVRIGIEAPRDIRILRGELESLEAEPQEVDDRAAVFAHPESNQTPGLSKAADQKRSAAASSEVVGEARKIIVGRVHRVADSKLRSAPLAHYVSAS